MLLRSAAWFFALSVALVLGVAGCGKNREAESLPPKTPTLRIYALGTLAGAMEPCGCVKSMLGGVDHAAELLRKKQSEVENSLLLAAGPLFFLNPELNAKSQTQELWKSEVVAKSLRSMKLRAWAPGLNDWAGGPEYFKKLTELSGAKPLAANIGQQPPIWMTEVGKTKIGVAGISVPLRNGIGPSGLAVQPPEEALRRALSELNKKGAQVRIALLALPRGDALRLAEKIEGFQLIIVGKPFDEGELNDEPVPAVVIGKTLVVAPQNHLQSLASVDLYVRADSYEFVDASGLSLREEFDVEQQRVQALQKMTPPPSELGQRKQALAEIERRLQEYKRPVPPKSGSFFYYQTAKVHEADGSHDNVKADMDAYYRRVNTHNKEAFKDRLPAPALPGQSHYVGVQVCSTCHQEEYAFWRTTRHAGAYTTLSTQNKEFNLDCVGCHVTGYEKPGGATVTHMETLQGVQCETCHGPGSRHVEKPAGEKLISRSPAQTLCAASCHHPPHVGREWTVGQAWPHIIGKGHGF
ncbi:MAG: multiheme c-type cytochrome [Polyangiaceae bacterium]|nr:multiheme c-type cytochrome [Polyangiaceae bacterium]